MNGETRLERPLMLTVYVDQTKTIDDVVSIARVEGRKKLGCNVKIVDLSRKSMQTYLVWVLPKYRCLDVGAHSGMQAE